MSENLDKNKILEKIQSAGVIGAGGAGFPTHVKLQADIEILVINCAECEPLLHKDQILLQQQAAKIIKGLQTLKDGLGVKKVVLGIKKKHQQLIEELSRKAKKRFNFCLLDDFYPAGDEFVLVYEATGRIIPPGGIPIQVGVAVVNTETLFNISESLKDVPVTTKWLTIGGAIPNPCTLQVPLGIAIRELLVHLGIDLAGKAVIDGGPMMGKLVDDLNRPVSKTTGGLLVLPENHSVIIRKRVSIQQCAKQLRSACIQCSYCSDQCPRNLLGHRLRPHLVMRAFGLPLTKSVILKEAYSCSECGLCEIVCPNGLSPRRINQFSKQEMQKSEIPREKQEGLIKVNSLRQYRRMPTSRVKRWLNLEKYDFNAPFLPMEIQPHKVTLSLSQHIGAPLEPLVAHGTPVTRGQLIATISKGKLGANLHASIAGIVTQVNQSQIVVEWR